MKILITVKNNPPSRYLVTLITQELIKEVKDLVNRKKHAQAMFTSFAKGSLDREVLEEDIPHIEADLMLSEEHARWDLVK